MIRANAAMNNAVGHKVSKLAVVSENDLVRTREMFETLAGDKGGITQASFSAFLSEAMPDMVEQARVDKRCLCQRGWNGIGRMRWGDMVENPHCHPHSHCHPHPHPPHTHPHPRRATCGT